MIISPSLFNTMLYVAGVCLVGILIAMVLLGVILAPYYDKQFPDFAKDKSLFENKWWIFSPYLRGATYAGCILFKNYSKRSLRAATQNKFFKAYDFHSNARLIDWLLVGGFIICLIGLALFGVLCMLSGQ